MSAVAVETYDVTLPTAWAEHVVTEQEVAAYRHVVRSTIGDGGVATACSDPSPVHPYVLAARTFDDALRSMAEVGGDGAPLPTPVHLSEEIRIHRPLRIGERVVVASDLVGARPDPRGVRVALRSQLAIADGAAVAETLTTALLIGDLTLERYGDVPLQRGRGGAVWTSSVTHEIPRDLPHRYADASGSDNPIHLDADAAQAVGFPDALVQGMSILAVACEEIIDRHAGGDARRVRSVGARFSGPVFPGDSLQIHVSDADGGIVHFCCSTERGAAIRKAWVDIAGNPILRGVDAS